MRETKTNPIKYYNCKFIPDHYENGKIDQQAPPLDENLSMNILDWQRTKCIPVLILEKG
jgi:hypothetical protein